MLRHLRYLVFLAYLLCSVFAYADSDHITIREDASCHNTMSSLRFVDQTQAAITSPDDARAILDTLTAAAVHKLDSSADCKQTDTSTAPSGLKFDAKDFYCLIHVFRWKDPDTKNPATKPLAPDKQNWYVYHAGSAWRLEDFKDRGRLFGSKNVWLLFIHMNARSTYPYEIRYDIDLKDILPLPLTNGLALAQVFAGSSGQGTGEVTNLWGMYLIGVRHLPNEMSVQPKALTSDTSGAPSIQNLSDNAVKFTNEGRYHFDFGVAVPIRKISETTVDTTNGVVTPKKNGTTNAIGVIDIYQYPNDIRNTPFSYVPYLVTGVAIAKQPLHKILLAVGWGPKFSQFYIGALFVKQQGATVGQPASVHNRYEAQFSFGINLTVKGFNDLAKKAK